MDKNALIQTFRLAARVVDMNLDGISHENGLKRPLGEGNCANWIAGHILVTRDLFLTRQGVTPFLSGDEAAPYARGSGPLLAGEPCMDMDRLREGLKRTGEDFITVLTGLDEAALEAELSPNDFPVPVEVKTLSALLTLLLFHESYHAGQIGIVRRSLGLQGSIP